MGTVLFGYRPLRLIICLPLVIAMLLFPGLGTLPAHADGQELRGIWVSRFDWKTQADLELVVQNAKAMGANAIFFQVRGEADAFYRSQYEPWSARLTGTLGKDPGWDPLGFIVERAHANGLEVHAWMNTYSAWAGATPPPASTPEHVLRAHPDWVAVDASGNPRPAGAEYTALSPGNPAVQQYIVGVIRDIVSNYAVDGIHLDYVRYSGNSFSYDEVSKSRLASSADNPGNLSREDWQRAQVTALVQQAYSAIKSIRPQTQLSAAVWGVYRNVWGWPIKNTGYDTYFQDTRAWLEAGIVDFVVPMAYWKTGGMPDFATVAQDFLGMSGGRGVYLGLGIYQPWANWDSIKAQIDLTRAHGGRGVVLFSYQSAVRYLNQLAAGPWSGTATTPWTAPPPPPPPTETATAVPPTATPTAEPTPVPTSTPIPTATPVPTEAPPTPDATATVEAESAPSPSATVAESEPTETPPPAETEVAGSEQSVVSPTPTATVEPSPTPTAMVGETVGGQSGGTSSEVGGSSSPEADQVATVQASSTVPSLGLFLLSGVVLGVIAVASGFGVRRRLGRKARQTPNIENQHGLSDRSIEDREP